MARVYANINPTILAWARRRAHLTEADLARKVGTLPSRYREWESGLRKPTLRQLHRLVSVLGEPLQTFYLDSIPNEPEILAEFRRLPDSVSLGEESPELTSQAKLAFERRELALSLYATLGETPPTLGLRIRKADDPELAGQRIRERLQLSTDTQRSWTDAYHALREWRTTLEFHGVLVFQIPGVSTQEMRGFSAALRPMPIIGINSKDSPTGRIFTLFHELAHILIGETILDTQGLSWTAVHSHTTEQFCNRVAAATLVPIDEDFRHASRQAATKQGTPWTNDGVRSLATLYKVSSAVVVRRQKAANLIDASTFSALRQAFDSARPAEESGGGGNFYANVVAHLGTLLPQLAFRNHYAAKLTRSELAEIFGLKANYLGRLEERVFGYNYAFEA